MDRAGTTYESRYWILAVFVFVLLAIQTSNQQWSSDFWEHSAAVREMSLHPLAPRHPLLAIDVPHHSYSLYGLALALAVRWLQISPIAALSAVAMLNAALLFLFFPLAGAALARRRDLAFYALLFTLLLWGPAWRYSGFLHMNALGFVLPFPSMFATALAFLVIGSMPAFLGNASWRTVLPVGALVFLVVNAHPITGGVLIVACLALAVSAHPGRPAWERLSVALVLGLLAAIWWPLYPFLPLVLDGARDIAFQNQSMYMDIIPRTAPALLGVPLLLRRQRKNVRDPLGLLFVGLLVIYGVGGISKQWTLGRVMPFLVLPLHISLAEWVVDQERKRFLAGSVGWYGPARVQMFVAGALIVTSIFAAPGLVRTVPRGWLPPAVRGDPRLDRPSEVFGVLKPVLADDDIVIAPGDISFIIPTFGGKVVTSRPHPFVRDGAQRGRDVARFFSTRDEAELTAILTKYGITKIVLDRRSVTDPARFRRFGITVFSNDRLEVISVQ